MADALERTAYHEAGHAVVALALGLPVKGVSIECGPAQKGGPDGAGHCLIGGAPEIMPRRDPKAWRQYGRDLRTYGAAGLYGQRLVDPEAPVEDAFDDVIGATEIEQHYGLWEDDFGEDDNLARQLVAEHAVAIAKLAAALLAARSLPGVALPSLLPQLAEAGWRRARDLGLMPELSWSLAELPMPVAVHSALTRPAPPGR